MSHTATQPAVWRPCPDWESDPVGHNYKDHCAYCSPWWQRYPVCPNDGTRLDPRGRCPACGGAFDVRRPAAMEVK